MKLGKTGIILIMLMVPLLLMGSSKASDATKEYGYVTVNDVNLRKAPGVSEECIAVLPQNAKVEILSYKDDWYHVVYTVDDEEFIGYVRQDLLFVMSLSGARSAYVLNDKVKLTGGAGKDSYTVTTLTAGEAVKLKCLCGEYYFVTAGEYSGYIEVRGLSVARPGSTSLEMLLRTGMSGDEVKKLQQKLYDRGFLSVVDITGYYGSKTHDAVKKFQYACNMSGDGIAGDATIKAIYDVNNKVTSQTAAYNRVKGTVELLDWFEGGSEWLHKGAYFTVTDVRTGLSFNVRRFGGWYHADSEPVTAEDTAIMKRISGGSWSWNRRAIWVTYNGRTVAASMHTMPHMVNPTVSNNFDGHFCIHLLNSRVHETSRPCPRHQACVMQAYERGKAD